MKRNQFSEEQIFGILKEAGDLGAAGCARLGVCRAADQNLSPQPGQTRQHSASRATGKLRPRSGAKPQTYLSKRQPTPL